MESDTPDTQLKDLMQKVHTFMLTQNRARRLVAKTQSGLLQKSRKILTDMGKKEERLLLRIENVMKKQEKHLQECLSVMKNADETLCNVLLAIRQNEYLQAWYPPQNGQDEQRVVGKYAMVNKEALK